MSGLLWSDFLISDFFLSNLSIKQSTFHKPEAAAQKQSLLTLRKTFDYN